MISRVVFGEPKPGEAPFAALLQRLDYSASYCNRTDSGHDYITDLPWVPNFIHPTGLKFVSAEPNVNDAYGLFRWHHITLYDQGAQVLPALDRECVRLCRAIYAYPGDPLEKWDRSETTDGVYWGLKLDGETATIVFRGSTDFEDWKRDLTGFDPVIMVDRLVHHDIFGRMWDGFLDGMRESFDTIWPLVKSYRDIRVTGHSLGASRADLFCGYALSQ